MKSKLTYSYRILAWSMLLLYLINPLRAFQPYLNYKLNYNYVSQVLCINKSKPKLECNGKCHLKKELKKQAEESQEKKSVNSKLTITEELSNQNSHIINNNLLISDASFLPLKASSYLESDIIIPTPPPQL